VSHASAEVDQEDIKAPTEEEPRTKSGAEATSSLAAEVVTHTSAEVGQEDVKAPTAEEPRTKSGAVALTLVVLHLNFTRMALRLLMESGMIFVLASEYGWGPANAGFGMGIVGVFCAIAQFLSAAFLAGRFADTTLMWVLEVFQLLGVALMFDVWVRQRVTQAAFFTGCTIAYCSSSVWGGIGTSFCLKRSQPGTVATQKTLLMINQMSIFAGTCLGAVGSRVLMDMSPGQNALAGASLVGVLMLMSLTAILIA